MPDWVDFKQIKQSVPISMVLATYGVRLIPVSPDSLRGRCPLPTHISQKSMLSFIVNTRRNIWACHSGSCATARSGRIGGNVLDFVATMEHCSIRDAALKLQGWFGGCAAGFGRVPSPAPEGYDVLPKSVLVEGKSALSDTASNTPLPFTLKGVDFSHPYLAGRGIAEDTAKCFGIGFFPGSGCKSGRIVIPIHNERGDLIAYADRALPPQEPRYKFPERFRKSWALFNLHRAIKAHDSTTVIIVEGFFDCLKLHQAGFPGVVALMGSTLSRHQEQLLSDRFHRVVLMLDGDEAGRSATAVIARHLAHKMIVWTVDVPQAKQPDQLTTDEMRRLLKQPAFS